MDMQSLIASIEKFNPQIASIIQENPNFLFLIAAQLIMKLIFYPWALYKAAERKQRAWFVILFIGMLILNDFGALPILYLIFNRNLEKQSLPKIKKSSKKKR